MEKYKKIYVFAPYASATGGIELAHQLVDLLRRGGQDAFIVYVDKGELVATDQVTEAYRCYDIRVSSLVEDSSDNMLILPEIYYTWVSRFSRIRIGCWWMSVDNFYVTSSFVDQLRFVKGVGRKLELLSQLRRKRYRARLWKTSLVGLLKRHDAQITHFYQSCYAQHHLYSQGFSTVLPLTDYINSELSGAGAAERENLILYNPLKGYAFTKRIIACMPGYTFVPLTGLTREQLRDLFSRAKLYIDFGAFPGKDRMPREAAINGCVVITGKNGASFFYEDLPLPPSYKFEMCGRNLPAITAKIISVLADYSACAGDFDDYRKRISDEKAIFEKEVEAIFG